MSVASQIRCPTPNVVAFSFGFKRYERTSFVRSVSNHGALRWNEILGVVSQPPPQNSNTPGNSGENVRHEWSFATSANSSLPGVHGISGIHELGSYDPVSVALTQRRLTLARLVKGVYELEYRRLRGISVERTPPVQLGWELVQFETDDEFHKQQPEKSIDLVVYKSKLFNPSSSPSTPNIGGVVVAIRGTLPSMEDGWHNFHGSLQRLHLTPRYNQILKVVKNAVKACGGNEVCITGHSLGATLGLLVARTLATEDRVLLECHLFNPIYAYTWMPTSDELLKNDGLWQILHTLRCATVAGLANIIFDDKSCLRIAREYAVLREWTPHLYINTGDPICRGYWEYFTNHERLSRTGALGAYIARQAAPFSGRGLLTTPLGSKPSHLIPSVMLHVCDGEPDPRAWLRSGFAIDPTRYFNHSLSRWMADDLPILTREVRLFQW